MSGDLKSQLRSNAGVVKKVKTAEPGTAIYYDIDSAKTEAYNNNNNNDSKKSSQTKQEKTKKMDGSEADGEWSDGDNEEEVIGSGEQMLEEYENGSADEEEEEEEGEEEEGEDSGTSQEEERRKSKTVRKVDHADYILDNIDEELRHIITSGVVMEKPRTRQQRENLAKQGVEFDYDSDNEKSLSVRSSQRMTSDTGTMDTGLGSGSMVDEYGSSDMENGHFETPRTDDTTTDADSEFFKQQLRHAVEAKARDGDHSSPSNGDGETPTESHGSERTASSSSTNTLDNESNPSEPTPPNHQPANKPVAATSSKPSASARVKLATVADVCEEAEDEYAPGDSVHFIDQGNLANFAEYSSEFDDEDLDRHLDAKVEAAVEKLLSRLSDANPAYLVDSPRTGDSATDREETPRQHASKPPSGTRTSSKPGKSGGGKGKSSPKKKTPGSRGGAKKAETIPEIYENGAMDDGEVEHQAPREARSQSPDGTMVAKGIMDPKQGFVPREIARVKKVSRHSDTESVATEDFENLFRDAMVVESVPNGRGRGLTGKPSSFLVRRMGSDTESVVTVATDKFEEKFHDIMTKELDGAERKPRKNPSPGPSPVKATYIPSRSPPVKLTRSSSNPPTSVSLLKSMASSKDRSRSMSPPVKPQKKYMVVTAGHQPRSSSPLPLGRPMKKAKSYDDMESVQTEDYMSRYIGSMVHQKIDPLPVYIRRSKPGSPGSDAESVMTEDYENSFRQMVVKQVAGVPITSFEDVYIASDLDSVKTGEIHKAIGQDGSNYQSESDLDSDKMEEIERQFQAIIRKKKETEASIVSTSDVDSFKVAISSSPETTPRRFEIRKFVNAVEEHNEKSPVNDGKSSTTPPKVKSSSKTPSKRTSRKSAPSRKPGVSRSAERPFPNHASADQREQLADQLEQRHHVAGQASVGKHGDSTSSLESFDFQSSSTSSEAGNNTNSSRTSSRQGSRADSAGLDSAGMLNAIAESMDVFSNDDDEDAAGSADGGESNQQPPRARHESDDSMFSGMSTMSFDDDAFDRRTCETQADVGDDALEEIEKLTSEESKEVYANEEEGQHDAEPSVEPQVVVTDTDGKRKRNDSSGEGQGERGKGMKRAASPGEKDLKKQQGRSASPQQQPGAGFAPRTLFEQLLDYKYKQGKLSPDSSIQLPYESDYEYMLRMRRMSPKGAFSRATSLDSSGSSVSDYLLENMDLTPTEDILMNLGFGGNDFGVPERFVRPWYAKQYEARIREVQESENVEPVAASRGDDRKRSGRGNNKENEPVRVNVEGNERQKRENDKQRREPKSRGSEPKEMRKEERKIAPKIVKSNDAHKNATSRRRQLVRAATVSSMSSSSEGPDQNSLKESKTRKRLKRLDIFDQKKVAEFEQMQDVLKERRRKQFARQKSLPACLETLAEEEDSQLFIKSPNLPKDRTRSNFFQSAEKSSQDKGAEENTDDRKGPELLDPEQERYMLAVKSLIDSKDSGFETGAAMSDNSRQASPNEQEAYTQTSEGSASPLVKLNPVREKKRRPDLQSDGEQDVLNTESDNELLDREVAEIVHMSTADSHTQTDSQVGSPSLSPICKLEPLVDFVDRGTTTDHVEASSRQYRERVESPEHRNPRLLAGLVQESRESVSSTETMVDAGKFTTAGLRERTKMHIIEQNISAANQMEDDITSRSVPQGYFPGWPFTSEAVAQTDLSLPANMTVGLMIHSLAEPSHSVGGASRISESISQSSETSLLDFSNSTMNAIQTSDDLFQARVPLADSYLQTDTPDKVTQYHADDLLNLRTSSNRTSELTSDFSPSQTQGTNKSRDRFSHSSYCHLHTNSRGRGSSRYEPPISRYFSSLPREFRGVQGPTLMPNEHLELFPNGKVRIMANSADEEQNMQSDVYASGRPGHSFGATHVCTECINTMQGGNNPRNSAHDSNSLCFSCGQRTQTTADGTPTVLRSENSNVYVQYEEELEQLANELVNSALEKVTTELNYGSGVVPRLSKSHTSSLSSVCLSNTPSSPRQSNVHTDAAISVSSTKAGLKPPVIIREEDITQTERPSFTSELFINVVPRGRSGIASFLKVELDQSSLTEEDMKAPEVIDQEDDIPQLRRILAEVVTERKKSSDSCMSYEDICLKAQGLIATLDKASAVLSRSVSPAPSSLLEISDLDDLPSSPQGDPPSDGQTQIGGDAPGDTRQGQPDEGASGRDVQPAHGAEDKTQFWGNGLESERSTSSGSQSFNGSRQQQHDDDDLDESLVQKVEALINKQKGRFVMSPRSLSASMPDVSAGRLSGRDLSLDETPVYTSHRQSPLRSSPHQFQDLDSSLRDVKSKKEIALKELNILHEALRRNQIDSKQAEKTAKDYYHKAQSLKSELMMLEFQRDQANRDLKDLEEDITNKNRARSQFQATPPSPKTEPKDETGMTAAEILSIVKERDDLRTKVRNGEGEMSKLERSELERQISNAKEELFNEQKNFRSQIEALQEELEDAKHRLDESESGKQQLAEQTAALEIKMQALENDTKKQIEDKQETYEGLKDKLAKEMATTNQEMEHRNRRVLALESDLAEKEMTNRQLQEKLIQMQSELRQESQTREKAVEERDRQSKAFQAEKDMALNNLRDELQREKDRELTEAKNKLEKERRDDFAKQEDKIAEQMAEFQQILLTKEEELELTRKRLRQQEDATRNLGDKMREEAKEQIKSAIAKEREIWEKEMERHVSREQESWEEQAAKNLAKLREELEQERQMALSFQNTISTLREEMEAHRQENRAAQREKIDAVTKAREAARKEKQAELDKLREKLTQEKFAEVDTLRVKLRDQDDELIQLRSDVKCHSQKEKEAALQAERHERSLVMEINDECKRIAGVTGGTPRKVPVTRTADYSPSVNGSPAKSPKLGRSALRPQVGQALGNLKSANEELRQHLNTARQELEREKKSVSKTRKEKEADLKRQRVQLERGKAAQMEALRDRLVKEHLEELNKLQKAVSKDDATLHQELRHKDGELKEIAKNMNQWKEETAQKMARKFEEELNRELDRRMKEQSKTMVLSYKNRLAEQQRQIERQDRELRKLNAEKHSASVDSPSQSSDASTIRLMRHLQERVKHLREENLALRRSAQNISFHSDSGTMDDTTPLASSGVENSESGSYSTYSSSKLEGRVRKLERQLNDAEHQSRENKDLLNNKMTEIEKLQSALTHQTKELMKLERAYAKVQSELATSSMR